MKRTPVPDNRSHFHGTGLYILLLASLWWALLPGGNPVRAQTDSVPEEEYQTYVVQAGDTLSGIAVQYGVPVSLLQVLNNLEDSADLILLGQILRVPVLAAPEVACTVTHAVQAGESLWGIAVRYGVTLDELVQRNQLANPNLVSEEQELCIPETGALPGDAGAAAYAPEFSWVIRSTESFWYTVNVGDTLEWIALRYGWTVDELLATNALDGNVAVVPGQLIRIPGHAAAEDVPSALRPWTARYYPLADLSGEPALVRYEEAIAHNWFSGAPGPAIPPDSFSALWLGDFEFTEQTYRFLGLADHGVRIFLDEEMVLDNWNPQDQLQTSVDISVAPGIHTVRVEYRELTGTALIFVTWFPAPPVEQE